jgi:hypothetical protein
MKYCDSCIHYLFKNNKHLCKAFGMIHFNESIHKKNIKQFIKYNEVEYTRDHPQLCTMDGLFYINKEEHKIYNQLFNNIQFNKRMKKFK